MKKYFLIFTIIIIVLLFSCGKSALDIVDNNIDEPPETITDIDSTLPELPEEIPTTTTSLTINTELITEETDTTEISQEIPSSVEANEETTANVKKEDDYKDLIPAIEPKKFETDMSAEYNNPKCQMEDMIPSNKSIENVYFGYNNFMFYGDTIPDYTGENAFKNDEAVKRLADMFISYDNWCKENNMTFYLLIPPNKNKIYSEYMFEGIDKADNTKYDMLVNYLKNNSDVKFIDIKEDLINAKNSNPDKLLYFKYDTHWNENAGIIASKKIIDTIRKDFPTVPELIEDDYFVYYVNSYMKDMPWYLGYYDTMKESMPHYILKNGKSAELIKCNKSDAFYGIFYHAPFYKDGYHDMNYYCNYKNSNILNGKKLYMIRDSFSIALIPFLKNHFSESSFSWTTEFNKTNIKNEKPDIVIFEMVERVLP